MSQTIQAALPIRPAVLAVIALHAALVVGLAMNFRYIVSTKERGELEVFDVPLPTIDRRTEPNLPPIGPWIFDSSPSKPDQPQVPMDQFPSKDTTPVSQPVGDAISPPKPLVWARPLIVHRTDIPYPTERGVKPEGTVRLRLRIGIDGRPLEVLLGASSGYASLDRAALNAVLHWRFKPRLRNGQPVESWAEMPIVFRLEN